MADGLYPKDAENAVQNVLRRAKGDPNPPKILDIGSGSGAWYVLFAKAEAKTSTKGILNRAVEMALRFPHARVVGMDLIESSPRLVYSIICGCIRLIIV